MTARPPFEPASPAERAALAPAIGDPRTWPAASWPDPQPLPEGLAPVAPFDYAMLPDRLRPWVQDVAERMQCPPDFVAVPMVAALGSLIGRRCAIRPQAFSDWQELPNLWGCIVGRPGMMKSPAMMAALAPVVRLEARALEEWTAAQGQWRAESEIAKARAEARKGEATKALRKNPDALVDVASFLTPEADEAPILRRYTVASATVEALAEKLIENPRGLLVVRDELPGWLAGLDREDAAELRAFLMTGWNGKDGWTFDRQNGSSGDHLDGLKYLHQLRVGIAQIGGDVVIHGKAPVQGGHNSENNVSTMVIDALVMAGFKSRPGH